MSFRRATQIEHYDGGDHKPRLFEAGSLPDSEKEALCRALLAEFGVTSVKPTPSGELIHSCVLPLGGHRNGDRNPSASLNWKKLTYNCLGCGSSGGLLWFVGLCRGTGGDDARRWLDEQTGTGLEEQSLSSLLEFFDAIYAPKDNRPAPLPRMSPKVLSQWHYIHPYMTEERGIPEETLVSFQVGYAEKYRLRLQDGEWIDSPRIVIPHFWKGELVGWQTRRLAADGSPKYASSPDMPKDRTIFNFDERRPAIVVESPMSVLALWHRTKVVESTFGAKVTDSQIRLLGHHKKVVLWFDNDEAGWRATQHVGEALESYSTVMVVENPFDADPADMVRDGHEEMAMKLIADAVPFALWKPPAKLVSWKAFVDYMKEEQHAVA